MGIVIPSIDRRVPALKSINIVLRNLRDEH